MGLKPLSMRQLEEHTDDIYEAVVVMSKRAKQILNDRQYEKRLREESYEEDYGVMDEISETNLEEFGAQEKPTSVAMDDYMEGRMSWYKASSED